MKLPPEYGKAGDTAAGSVPAVEPDTAALAADAAEKPRCATCDLGTCTDTNGAVVKGDRRRRWRREFGVW